MTQIDLSSLAGTRIECACGRVHNVSINKIVSGRGVINTLPDVIADFHGKHIFLVGDNNTMPLAADFIRKKLAQLGCEVSEVTLHSDTHLILDEALIGRLMVHMPTERVDLIVTIGSGTLGDLCRVISARCNIPYVIIGTAPSMDGYASAVSPIVMADGGKRSIPLCAPYAIIADTDLMKKAPDVMLSAGVGDILGKNVALADWRLARQEINEYYCEYIAGLVAAAMEQCTAGIPKIAARDPDAIKNMADTLILSGVTICLHGLSRPASGCEHQLGHYWETSLLKSGKETALHGNFVALGTIVACRMYELVRESCGLELSSPLPSPTEIIALMNRTGDFCSVKALNITREMFYESFFHAGKENGRYTLLSWLEKNGNLEQIAVRLTEEFFGI